MRDGAEEEDDAYAAVSLALTALIRSHYRPTGHDADASFASLRVWAERLELGDALSSLSVIHVAGTKGKGSTCAFAESILRSCGRRTGLFTSPHLVDIRERFRLDG
jgi:folylpolyglutamate synthase